jgi:hypothetical protein
MVRGPQFRISRKLLALFMPVALVLGAIGAPSAAAVVRMALINGDTVSGSPSQEEAIATALGFAVTVVSDATWGAMTASDFGQYDLLIAGDPTCGTLPPGLGSSASVYGPVVLGLAGGRTEAGNRIVVGTDPVYHDGGDYTSPGARGTIIREGIAYAGSQPGRTGMYFDSTCAGPYGQSAEILAILEALSAGGGAWTIDASPPCGGSVSLIASNPSFADLTTASLEGWGCSVHESFPTFRTDWSALAVATDTTSHPTCGVDPGTGLSACGEAYLLIAGSAIVVNSLVISVSPLDSTNPIGTDHTVTANVHAVGGTPVVAGQLVTFTVTGQNAGATGTCAPVSCLSDASGNVTFTYHDTNGAGDDTIKASFTDAAGSLQTATAQKHWTGVTSAHTTLTESASPASGLAPLAVTFTYNETNDGTDPISGVTVSGSSCGTAVYVSGDTNTNGILDPTETWVFTCSKTYTAAGSVTDNATATGTDTVDSAAAPVETASASVSVTTPGKILPTNTECTDFVNNTTPALAGIFYSVKGGNIGQNINPGVFFYYTYVTTTTANQLVTTSQHATNGAPLFSLNQGHIWVYTAPNCALVSQPTQAGTSVSLTIATPGTYVLRLQYSTKSIAGKTAPTASPSLYTFDINGTDNASVPLKLQ